jgi:bisphosphoglycerate-independent phosphoglycerate mutase (AlkP superfamily)
MKFIEVTVKDHMILHGFNQYNKEILEEVKVENVTKKLIAVERIQSIGERYILTSYGFDRLIYWEYEEDYEDLKQKLLKLY